MSTNLYGKVYARYLEDRRTHAAARRLAHLQEVPEEWAVHSVLSLLASIDAWLIAQGRAAEGGQLPDDGFAVARAAAALSPAAARAGIAALLHGKWLVRKDGQLSRAGFREDYADLLEARETSRKWRAGRKAAAAVPPPPPGVGSAYGTRDLREGDGEPTASRDSRASESQSLEASASKASLPGTAVAVPPASTSVAATAPGGKAAPAACCGRCKDGLLFRKGRKPKCCDCPRGRERAFVMARAIGAEHESKARHEASRVGVDGEDRGAVAIGAVLPGVLEDLGRGRGQGPSTR